MRLSWTQNINLQRKIKLYSLYMYVNNISFALFLAIMGTLVCLLRVSGKIQTTRFIFHVDFAIIENEQTYIFV